MEETSAHVQDFLAHLAERNLSQATVKSYRVDLGHFEDFLQKLKPDTLPDERITSVSKSELVAFVDQAKKHYSPATVYRQTGTIRSLYRWLLKMRRIECNLALHLKCVRVPASISVPVEAIDDFIAHTDICTPTKKRDHLMAQLIYETGMRISEVLTLNRGDVKDCVVFFNPPGRRSRMIPISKKLADILRSYLHDTDDEKKTPTTPLFLNKFGERITCRSVRRHFAKNNINPRSLRVRFVQIQREAGVNDETIAERLGLNSHFSIGHIPGAPPRPKGKLKATRKISTTAT